MIQEADSLVTSEAEGTAPSSPAFRLVLASASPRRRMLMTQIGLQFEVRPAEVDEQSIVAAAGDEREIGDQVVAAAVAKARAAAAQLGPVAKDGAETLVIGADTVVLTGGEVLGKPADTREAAVMLRKLSGRTHQVLSGVAVLNAATGHVTAGVEQTSVAFVPLAQEWVSRYVSTGEPMDKAGAYAVQGLGSVFIERVEGCYFNVVGLPLALLAYLLRQHGYEVSEAW